jgi:hypothetical protein
VNLLHQLGLGADRVKRLQQKSAEQTFRCNRRPSAVSVDLGELAIERDEHLVDNASDKPKRMLRWNSSPLRSSDPRILASPLGKNSGIRFARPRQPPFSAACSHVRSAAAVSRLRLSPDAMRRRQRLKTPVNKLSCAGWLPHDRDSVSGCLVLETSVGTWPAHNRSRGFPAAARLASGERRRRGI